VGNGESEEEFPASQLEEKHQRQKKMADLNQSTAKSKINRKNRQTDAYFLQSSLPKFQTIPPTFSYVFHHPSFRFSVGSEGKRRKHGYLFQQTLAWAGVLSLGRRFSLLFALRPFIGSEAIL